MNPALANRLCDGIDLIGVIDLIGGRAVHAIAGNRKSYRDVSCCGGDPLALAQHYVALGLTSLYVADLDAISGKAIQTEALRSLLEVGVQQTMIDVGWRGDESHSRRQQVIDLALRYPAACWIAASESCRSADALVALVGCVSATSTLLGLDYRQGKLLSYGPSESDWIAAAIRAQCAGAVILDVAAVGTGDGPVTAETCQRIRTSAPPLKLYSGGGIRNCEDAQSLIDAGCDGVLMATALYPGCEPARKSRGIGGTSDFNLPLEPLN